MIPLKVHIKGDVCKPSCVAVDEAGNEYDIGIYAFTIKAEAGKKPEITIKIKNTWLDISGIADITENKLMDSIKKHKKGDRK